MAIITLSRELGSGGGQITNMITNSLRYRLVDKMLIEKVLSHYGFDSFDKLYQSPHNIWTKFEIESNQVITLLNKVILAFSRHNNTLIVGRGGFVVLHAYCNVLNVLIKSPFETRVERLMIDENIENRSEALERVKKNDLIRDTFLQAFYDVTADSTQWFDLIIDTSKIPLNLAGRWIMEAAKAIDQQRIRMANTTFTAKVDLTIIKTVSKIFTETNETRSVTDS